MGFLGDTVVKNLPANARDAGLIPGLGRSPGVGSGNPLQYSCLGNSMHRGAWRARVYEVTESDVTERLSIYIDIAQNLYNHSPTRGYTGCF